MRRASLLLLFGLLTQAVALGQSAPHFTSTKEPASSTGVKSLVDLPVSQHMRNSGGNDRTKSNPLGRPGQGYGLCVFTSIEIESRWQNVPEISGFQKWMENKPGGGYPQKVDQMIAAFCKEKSVPVPEYVQHTGGDDAFLDLAMSTGRGCCVTYAGFDGFYKDRSGQDCWIDHMVYLAHLDQEWAAIIDNNRPGYWVWMSRKDFLLRWRARGGGWAFVLLAPPPPPHLFSQMLFAATGCVCGDSCACPPGDCPARCPVLFGQCSNGRCPVPLQVVPLLPDPFAPSVSPDHVPGGGQWRANTNGQEWGYWVNGRCIAAAFADGRVEATNQFGIATGVPIEPPAALPAGVRAQPQEKPAVPVSVGENYGLVRDKIHQRTTYSITGHESTEETVYERMLNNDGDRWHLTAVGDPAFLVQFAKDVKALPESVRARIHVQSYAAESWTIKLFALPSGVCLRKPASSRRSEQSGCVLIADYSAAKLAELLDLMNGPKPVKPVKPTPDATPNADPKPSDPPAPAPRPNPLPFLLAVGVVLYLIWRK